MAKQKAAQRTGVAAEVRAELARHQISGRELARRMDATAVYVSRRLSGEVELSASDLASISEILDIPVGYFFGEVAR